MVRYLELSTELLDQLTFTEIENTFTLIIKPLSLSLHDVVLKRDPDALDLFFLEALQFFSRASESQLDDSHFCRLMCIDVHKLRLLAFKNRADDSAFNFATEYLKQISHQFPEEGRYWFQWAIIEMTFNPSTSSKSSNFSATSLFYSLLFRSLLARHNPIDQKSLLLLLKRIPLSFQNTLNDIFIKTFIETIESDSDGVLDTNWTSFVRYFHTFTCNSSVKLDLNDFASLCLLLFALFRISDSSQVGFLAFLDAALNAPNYQINRMWPFLVYCLLRLDFDKETKFSSFAFLDQIWFKIFQLLKAEEHIFYGIESSGRTNSMMFTNFLKGTIFVDESELKGVMKDKEKEIEIDIEKNDENINTIEGNTEEPFPDDDECDLSECFTDELNFYYDFHEDFSIERDQIIQSLLTFFNTDNGKFRHFITLRHDNTIRLGSYFCRKEGLEEEQEREQEQEGEVEVDHSTVQDDEDSKDDITDPHTVYVDLSTNNCHSASASPPKTKLDKSIEQLRVKLSKLQAKVQVTTRPVNSEAAAVTTTTTTTLIEEEQVNYNSSIFIVDTNVLIANSDAIYSQLQADPKHFIFPLIVLAELERIKAHDVRRSERAQEALQSIRPLLPRLRIVNNFGRLLRVEEVSQQLSLLSLSRLHHNNDDQIIHLATSASTSIHRNRTPILLTEDMNMRLKAKSKGIQTISTEDFRQILFYKNQ